MPGRMLLKINLKQKHFILHALCTRNNFLFVISALGPITFYITLLMMHLCIKTAEQLTLLVIMSPVVATVFSLEFPCQMVWFIISLYFVSFNKFDLGYGRQIMLSNLSSIY